MMGGWVGPQRPTQRRCACREAQVDRAVASAETAPDPELDVEPRSLAAQQAPHSPYGIRGTSGPVELFRSLGWAISSWAQRVPQRHTQAYGDTDVRPADHTLQHCVLCTRPANHGTIDNHRASQFRLPNVKVQLRCPLRHQDRIVARIPLPCLGSK